MVLLMRIYILLIQLAMLRCVSSNTPYECGKNGRFEYCIDEIPGCVIGCHCHPGYYFDTDTKICEPNTKLIEHHRRHKGAEPTRAQIPFATRANSYTELASTVNPVDAEVEEISKDADNLGDWLYNQFFKTIENQVINSTNREQLPTRRSGGRAFPIKAPKRAEKTDKRKSQKKRNKKQNLKRKLMRISEDHSIFDESSSSTETDSSDGSSSGTSTQEDSKEHGHKKIVMFQKKPKPPLPSFIFLPNMDTPYYPPLGLPPPPVISMYPIIPIPPVLPAFPIPAVTTCREETQKIETTSESFKFETTDGKINNVTTEHLASEHVTSTDVLTEVTTGETADTLREKLRHSRKKKKKNQIISSNPDKTLHALELRLNKLSPMARQKMIQQLRKKLRNTSPNLLISPWNAPNNEFSYSNYNKIPEDDGPMLKDNMLPEEFINNQVNQANPIKEHDDLKDNVGFKYISQLIHRVNVSKGNNIVPIEYKSSNYEMEPQNDPGYTSNDFNTPLDANDLRRRINRLSNSQLDDLYFSKLGRQIADVIRGLDSEKQKVEIELESKKDNPAYAHSPYFNYNSPKSFWERSVRSPFKYINSHLNKFEYLKKSSELLFDIENKVEILASTARSLDLHEMENIVNMMEVANRKIQNNDKPAGPVDTNRVDKNLNINLWPKELYRAQNIPITPSIVDKIKTNDPKKNNLLTKQNILPATIDGLHMEHVNKLYVWGKQPEQKNKHNDHILSTNNKAGVSNRKYFQNYQQKHHIAENDKVFIPYATTSRRLNTNIPSDRDRHLFFPINKQSNILPPFSNKELNGNVFKPISYFQHAVGQYDYIN